MSAARPGTRCLPVTPTRLNPTDATLWDIERDPMLRTTIVATMVLGHRVRRDRLVNTLEAATRQVPRLRERVVEHRAGIGVPHWEVDPSFRLADHLRVVTVPTVDEAALAAVVEPLATEPFDRARPLWECVYVLPRGRSGSSALVFKVHHSLTDGVGGIGLLDALLDRHPDAPPRDLRALPIPVRAPGPRRPDTTDLLRRGVELPFAVAEVMAGAAFHPRRTAADVSAMSRSAYRLLAPSTSTLSALMAGRGSERRVGTSDIELARLHRAAARHGCTINDAFFAGALGGVAAYHRAMGAPTNLLRVTMPVSFRRGDQPGAGNQWAPVRLVVPTDVDDPVERLRVMSALARSGRRERALSFTQRLAGTVQSFPSAVSSAIVAGMMRGVDVTLTNVPGLSEPHYLAGAPVDRIYAFAPTAGAALNIGLVSHLDTACLGTLSDAAAVSDPVLLQLLIETAFDDLLREAERRPPSAPRQPVTNRPGTTKERSSPRAERLSALDAGFLRLETPDTPMHITAVFVLDGHGLRDPDGTIRSADIRRHVEARVRRLPRFTQRVAEVPLGLGRPVWVDDDRFRIERHVRVTSVRSSADEHALLDRAAELIRDPIDREHPLWELWLVDGLADGRVGIVEKLHHALVDGLGGVELAATVFDLEPCDEPDQPAPGTVVSRPGRGRLVVDAITEQLTDPPRVVARGLSSLAGSPARAASQALSVLAAGGGLASPGGMAPRTSFNRSVGGDRTLRAITTDLVPLLRFGERHDATVNDVVLAAVSGGVRAWLLGRGEPLVDVHVLVPVSVRHGTLQTEPGNHVGGVVLTLPIGEPDAARRLSLVQHHMRRAKAAHEGEGAALALGMLDHVPAVVDRLLVRAVEAQPFVNLVVTNVPGSPVPLHLLGSRIETIVPVVPLGPGLGLGVAVLSYAGSLTVSLSADPAICPDLDALAAAVGAEIDAMSASVQPAPQEAFS
jgi:diacylglycerol O-acyltransferase / wax synthase